MSKLAFFKTVLEGGYFVWDENVWSRRTVAWVSL